MTPTPAEAAYPRLIRRFKGAAVDGVVVPIAAIGSLVLIDSLGVESAEIKIACAVLTILLLEPFAVAFTGGTVGHHAFGMRVRRKSADQRLNVFAALLRFVTKTLFGLPSFFVALITRNRQALHDVAAGSVVVYKSTIGLPDYEVLAENSRDDEQRRYLSVWRRLLVILLYWLLCYLGLNLVIGIFFYSCASKHVCSDSQVRWIIASLVVTLVVFVAIAVLGWRGALYGCRKQANQRS